MYIWVATVIITSARETSNGDAMEPKRSPKYDPYSRVNHSKPTKLSQIFIQHPYAYNKRGFNRNILNINYIEFINVKNRERICVMVAGRWAPAESRQTCPKVSSFATKTQPAEILHIRHSKQRQPTRLITHNKYSYSENHSILAVSLYLQNTIIS